MRYHSNIFAAKMNTPFIAVAYEEKMEGFIRLASLDDYSIELSDISFEQLNHKFIMIEKNHREIVKKLKIKLPEWKKKAEKTLSLITSLS